MANNIPVFELNKDSYILKHQINYNTSNEGIYSALTYGILFTDYELARKTQSSNAENFSGITINEDINTLSSITWTYYDQTYKLEISNHYRYKNLVLFDSGVTGTSSINTLYNARRYQEFYISDSTSNIQVGDYFNIYLDGISRLTGTTNWEHFGPSGETWIVTGTTDNQIPWQLTGTTIVDGYSSGTDIWDVLDNFPLLKYRAKVLIVGSNYLRFEKKLEDYLYNNIIRYASGTSYTDLNYTLESLDFSDRSYYGIKYILEENVLSNYFSISATTDQITIQPIPTKENLYFDYDNVVIKTTDIFNNTIPYKFETNNLYTKYKLDTFLNQLGYDSGSTIYLNHSAITSGYVFTDTGITYYTMDLINSGDTEYFLPYTFINVSGNTNHICLITNISGNTLTILTPRTGITIGEQMTSINNVFKIKDDYPKYGISDLLYQCYINIENLYVSDYRILGIQTRKNIYRTYAGIFENLIGLETLREKLTGILFENENAVFTFKLYNPYNYKDNRLLYNPIEITKIGKNKKTTIPVKVYGLTSGNNFDYIDSELYDRDVYDSNIYESVLVFDSNL